MSLNRRTVLKGALATSVATSALKVPAAVAQAGPIKVGFLTIKSGALASGGLQMEQGMVTFFKERNNMLAGRPVELQTADTGGNPAQARTKTQELVERFNVNVLIGPLAAFEALAIDDYIRSSKTPILTVAGAEDMTQRKPNPWLVRPSSTSSQPSHPMGDYAAKDLKLKRAIAIADDFAFGHENVAGFLRAFEDGGRQGGAEDLHPAQRARLRHLCVAVQERRLPLHRPRRLERPEADPPATEYGLKGKFTIVGGFTPIDESVLQQMGEDGVGCYSGCWYSAALDNPINKKFVETIRREYKVDPGVYAAETYLCGEVLEHALKTVNGKIEDKDVFMKALKEAKVPATLAGPVSFDEFGNVVGNIYIRKVEKKDGKYLNTVVKTYPNVSQFWTYGKDEFLKNPVYSRDYPPAKNLE